jgi:hypothetical protein
LYLLRSVIFPTDSTASLDAQFIQTMILIELPPRWQRSCNGKSEQTAALLSGIWTRIFWRVA